MGNLLSSSVTERPDYLQEEVSFLEVELERVRRQSARHLRSAVLFAIAAAAVAFLIWALRYFGAVAMSGIESSGAAITVTSPLAGMCRFFQNRYKDKQKDYEKVREQIRLALVTQSEEAPVKKHQAGRN